MLSIGFAWANAASAALRELRGDDMREIRRRYSRQDLVWVA